MLHSDYLLTPHILIRVENSTSPIGFEFRRVFDDFLVEDSNLAPCILIKETNTNELSFKAGKTKCDSNFFIHQLSPSLFIGFKKPKQHDYPLEINLHSLPKRVKNPLLKFLQLCLLGKPEAYIQRLLSYHGLWSLLHIALLQHNHAFLHAGSVVEQKGKSTLIVGVGGAGKTSCTTNLVTDYNYKYQSEDFAIINKNGESFLSPRPLTIYDSDVKWGNKALVAFKKNLSFFDSWMWLIALISGRNPRRRALPKHVFNNDKIQNQKAEIENVFFILRSSTKNLQITNITTEAMVERCLSVSVRELLPIFEPLLQMQACVDNYKNELTINQIINDTKNIYISALKNKNCYLIEAPHDMGPDKITETIHKAIHDEQ